MGRALSVSTSTPSTSKCRTRRGFTGSGSGSSLRDSVGRETLVNKPSGVAHPKVKPQAIKLLQESRQFRSARRFYGVWSLPKWRNRHGLSWGRPGENGSTLHTELPSRSRSDEYCHSWRDRWPCDTREVCHPSMWHQTRPGIYQDEPRCWGKSCYVLSAWQESLQRSSESTKKFTYKRAEKWVLFF